MNDFREEMVKIIKNSNYINKKSSYVTEYYYPEIPDKVIKNFKKNVCSDINANGIIAIADFTLFNSGKEGVVFTTTGIYIKQMLIKKSYFNYSDIERISEDIYLEVWLNNKKKVEISESEFYKINLIDLLLKLKDYTTKNDLMSKRESGILKKINMPKELTAKCNAIIHSASVGAGAAGAGFAQLPCSDAAVITPIQVGMIVGLGKVFDMEITDAMAKAIIGGMAGAFVGRGFVQIAVGWIPIAGNAINTATAAGLTEAIGWTAANQFYNESLDNSAKYSLDGEKRGYVHASDLYEKKLRSQAEKFLKQQKVCEEEKEALNKLIDEYEKYINEHENSWNVNDMRDEVRILKYKRNIS